SKLVMRVRFPSSAPSGPSGSCALSAMTRSRTVLYRSRTPHSAPALLHDFTAHGLSGRARVSYGTNDDPRSAGMDMLGIDDGTGNRARRFPVIAGTVEYPVACYRTIMGWIQTVRVT